MSRKYAARLVPSSRRLMDILSKVCQPLPGSGGERTKQTNSSKGTDADAIRC